MPTPLLLGRTTFISSPRALITARGSLMLRKSPSLSRGAPKSWRGRPLPATVHSLATHRVWQRRFYDMNIRNEAKVAEKLRMHVNPIKARLGLLAGPVAVVKFQVLPSRGQFSGGDGLLPPLAADTANCAASAPPQRSAR